jgi:hypothetical protein
MSREVAVENPLIIAFKHEGETITHLCPERHSVQEYGAWIADIVRHAAIAFNVKEDEVWRWVDEERYRPRAGTLEEIKLQQATADSYCEDFFAPRHFTATNVTYTR